MLWGRVAPVHSEILARAHLVVILTGYVAGIAKVLLSDGPGGFLLIPYGINFVMVSIDTLLYFRNRRLDKQTGTGA